MSEDLKKIGWDIDKIWAKVSPAGEATASWGREQTRILVDQYAKKQLSQVETLIKCSPLGETDKYWLFEQIKLMKV